MDIPASGVCCGLKSDEGDADDMNVEWLISVEPSTGRDDGVVDVSSERERDSFLHRSVAWNGLA